MSKLNENLLARLADLALRLNTRLSINFINDAYEIKIGDSISYAHDLFDAELIEIYFDLYAKEKTAIHIREINEKGVTHFQ